MMKNIYQLILALVLSFYLMACDDNKVDAKVEMPELITIKSEGLFPEGFVFDASDSTFYMGSLTKGKVVKVDLEGNVDDFIETNALRSVLGMVINKATNQLLICNSDPGFSEKTTGEVPPVLANVVAYDLTTGQEVANYDLASLLPVGTPLLVNDIVLDAVGNAYISNSFAPVVFKISTGGDISVFVSSDSWIPNPGSFGLNGIEYHKDGFLLLAQYEQGALYKVPLDNPYAFTKISVDTDIHSVDGIRLLNDNTLAWVSNVLDPSTGLEHIIYEVKSSDNWKSASVKSEIVIGKGNEFPTTIEIVNGESYVIYSHLRDLMAGNSTISEFELKKVIF